MSDARPKPRASESSFDPFSVSLRPPENETEEERQARLDTAREALRISRSIDAALAETKKALERKRHAVKILLLGQSESGKSSVLRNFRIAFTPKYFESERLLWKTVIQMNLISCIKRIITTIQAESAAKKTDPPDVRARSLLTSEHERLALSLSPLLAFETSVSNLIESSKSGYTVTVRAGSGWKEKLGAGFGASRSPTGPTSPTGADPTEVTHLLAACSQEISALWADASIREILKTHAVALEEEPGFFMDDAARITSLAYVPTDRDIVRARIKTLGVEEHRFVTESGFRAGTEFFITDVCGSSSQRATWVPYFDDVQAILFLAPLAFWQYLDEDTKVNRVQDSLELWREIIANPLLSKTAFILLFNKKDILQAQLDTGISVAKYVPSFGDRPNTVSGVTKYFRDKFSAYYRKYSPRPRPFIFYETEAIDTKSMSSILAEVQEQIIRNHLKDLDVM